MTWNRILLLAAVALGLYAVGNIWPVQLSSYRLWTYVGQREFHTYHLAWWRSIWGVILAPAALLLVVSVLMLRWRPAGVPGWAAWLGVGLQAALAAGTALWWGPLMARLSTPEGGLARELYLRLMATHWLRVAIVTAYGALALWMMVKDAWLSRAA
jgi:hypothetical protein